MHDDFNAYRAELDRLHLTPESKQALTASLARRQSNPARSSPRRLPGTLRLAGGIAAAICLLGTVGYAAITSAPTLLGSVFDGGAAYEQSSGFIGRSVDNNGWTVTITDCVGDDKNLYIGLELAAPEDAVLDADWYCFGTQSDLQITFSGGIPGLGREMHQLPDEDPADNRLAFIICTSSVHGINEEGSSFNGQKMRLKLPELRTGTWNSETMGYDYTTVCPGKWDFGTMTVSYPDSTIHLEPDLPVTTLGVDAVITEVDVSPLSVYVRIEGDALKGHHSWVPKNAPDGWYGCIEYQEIVLHFDDGTSFAVDQNDSNLGGSGCSGGTDVSEDGLLVLRRTYSANINGVSNRLIDVDRVTSVSVCGVDIPLR